jgi:hypothetical protein
LKASAWATTTVPIFWDIAGSFLFLTSSLLFPLTSP